MTKKSILKSAAVAALVLSAVSVEAKSKIAINRYLKTNYAVISVLSPETDVFRIEIMDYSGNVVYSSERVKDNSSFHRLYDLSNLSDGTYSVKYYSKAGTVSEKFEVKESKVVK